MNQNAATTAETCIFCAIASRHAVASVAYEDNTVVAFMDRYPVTVGDHGVELTQQRRRDGRPGLSGS